MPIGQFSPTKYLISSHLLISLWFLKIIYNFQRFDPETTNGEGPYWLKNLYFVYLLELRALAKAAPYLRKQSYFTGKEI